MKKRAVIVLAVVLIGAAVLVGGLRRQIGASTLYSTKELHEAMDVVETCFQEQFPGCTLLKLCYDEDYSNALCGEWTELYGADEAIILTSSFLVGSEGGDGSLNSGMVYDDWQWILTRSHKEPWCLQTWGY